MTPLRAARLALAKHRKALGLSVRAAAKQLRVSHVAWLGWESGKRVPSEACRKAIARWTKGVVAEASWPKSRLDTRMAEVA